ncbi:helix-turn-helix transcriptional regulator [Actinomycetes bacterium KLBMP 9797]
MARQPERSWWTDGVYDGRPIREVLAARDIGAVFRFLKTRGMSRAAIAAATGLTETRVRAVAQGKQQVTSYEVLERIAVGLDIERGLLGLAYTGAGPQGRRHPASPKVGSGQETDGEAVVEDECLDAVELTRRVAASDVSAETLDMLEAAFDDLATAYGAARPEDLLQRTRQHLAYVVRLVEARKTLAQHRRLLVVGGWLSLLAATVSIDLRRPAAAGARLGTAQQLAEHAEHREIRAWIMETQAWDRLNVGVGDYVAAVELSQRAQAIAPRGSSAFVQATAQEARAWARMRRQAETREALDRLNDLVSSLPVPERPEHHYRYDPNKAISYTATTLAWAGDPAAEDYARTAIDALRAANDGASRPRRVALAHLDLGLALLAAGQPDEAAFHALEAISSGRVVPSNWWRVDQVVSGVASTGIPEAQELREASESHRPANVA